MSVDEHELDLGVPISPGEVKLVSGVDCGVEAAIFVDSLMSFTCALLLVILLVEMEDPSIIS